MVTLGEYFNDDKKKLGIWMRNLGNRIHDEMMPKGTLPVEDLTVILGAYTGCSDCHELMIVVADYSPDVSSRISKFGELVDEAFEGL